ncbi:MAG: amidohydrolase [Clostridiales bacterium]|nr:amidohydrolase [Clostridiales bacterium]
MLLKNARIFPMDGPEIPRGFVAFEDGKFTAVGPMEDCPPGEGLDLAGRLVYPGFVDAHCHLGVFGDGLGFEGEDANETTDPVTPQLRGIDGVNPMDRCFQEAREGGVTTVVTGPGSANPIGGQLVAVKTAGRWIDRMVVKAPAAMKFALGENPKQSYNDRDETPITRMATAALIREELAKTREYLRKQERAKRDEDAEPPDYDCKLEALIPVLQGTLPAHFHAHRADDIATALRIAREFRLNAVIVHGTEGYLVADILAEEGVPVITGPIFGDRSKPELKNQALENTAVLMQAGVPVAICTDHPENPIQYLPLGAALAVKAGAAPEEAMQSITLRAAQIAGIDSRVGSITPGKDADLVVLDGSPLEVASTIQMVFIDGKRVK